VRDETVARNYAEALFELAEGREGIDAFSAGVADVARVLEEDPRFRIFLETPRIDASDKKAVIRKAFEDRVPRSLLNFLLVVVDKRRQRLLGSIARQFQLLVDDRLGRTHVEVTVSREVGAEELASITARLSTFFRRTAIPHLRVRPDILGGVVLRTGDTIYDGSLRRRLARMRRNLLSADLPALTGR
jgi:F-type H+-transporting ATPase subunit delta